MAAIFLAFWFALLVLFVSFVLIEGIKSVILSCLGFLLAITNSEGSRSLVALPRVSEDYEVSS